MPPVKIEKVVSVSSEDTVHVAANLLKQDFGSKKWKSRTPGEKQITVVLQLEHPSKISSVDVGNENTAFIEILVSKCSTGTDDFKVLLATTALMTLQDANRSENGNAVKFFRSEDLCEDTRNEKWDRVKIVCLQPYSVYVQHGLSFIVFHTESAAPSTPDLGKFHLRVDDQPNTVSAWNLLAKKKIQVECKGAAAVRCGVSSIFSPKNKPIVAKVEALSPNDVMDDEENDNPTPGQSKKPKTPKTQPKKKDNTPPKTTIRPSPIPKKPSPKKIAKVQPLKPICTKPMKPFNRLMEDVVFVISGFQNPLRSDLRNSALAMGAKYKADWDSSCTHLICAFVNTPKFNQVRGRGKIVTKNWIEECYGSRKRLPWRRFALDRSDQGQRESEEEILEDTGPGPSTIDNRRRLNDSSSEEDDIEREVKRIQKRQQKTKRKAIESEDEDEEVAGPSGLNTRQSSPPPPPSIKTSSTLECDVATQPSKPVADVSVYDVDTEEDEASDIEGTAAILNSLPTMPSFFETYNFVILDDIEESQRTILKRYILARLGNVVADMKEITSSSPSYCITEDETRLVELKECFPNVIGVRADWIWMSHDENSLQDINSFLL